MTYKPGGGPQGPAGPQGNPGAAGAAGAQGPAGPLDIVALAKSTMPYQAQLVLPAVWSATNLGAGDTASWGQNGGGARTLVQDANGIRHDYATTAATGASASVSTSNPFRFIQTGFGFAFRMAVTSIADGKAAIGINSGNSLQNGLIQSNGVMYQQTGCAICYDIAAGHTNWQFWARGTGGFAGTFTDSGIAIAANTPLVFVVDAVDATHVTMSILDDSHTVLATYTTPGSGNPQLDATATYALGGGVGTPSSGSPAARSMQWWGLSHWRRK